jgi:hypothetical protein
MEWSTGGYIISAEDLLVSDELLAAFHPIFLGARRGQGGGGGRRGVVGWPEGEERVAALGSGHSVTWG